VQIEFTTTLSERVLTDASILPDGSLSVSHEVDYEIDDIGPRYEAMLGYRVPVERVDELLSALPSILEGLESVLDWAASDNRNAAAFRAALREMEPTVKTSSWVW
jgi:hypothetical protein